MSECEIKERCLNDIKNLYSDLSTHDISPYLARHKVEKIIIFLRQLEKIDNDCNCAQMINELNIIIEEDISREIIEFDTNNRKFKTRKYSFPKSIHNNIYCAIYDIISNN